MRKEVLLLEVLVGLVELLGLLDEFLHLLLLNFLDLRVILIGIGGRCDVEFVLHTVLVVTLCTHYKLTQQESNRINRKLPIYTSY